MLLLSLSVIMLLFVGDSDERLKNSLEDTGVYDCRFWREPKQEIATIIIDNRLDTDGSVFYYWDSVKNECLPCTVCPERTLSMCWYVKVKLF